MRPYDGGGARLREEVMDGTFPRLCPGRDGTMYYYVVLYVLYVQYCTVVLRTVQPSQSMQEGRLSRIMVRTCRLADC